MTTFIDPSMQQVITQIHAAGRKLVFEFAGAGSLALFWLHAVPGSSRTVAEATDRYAPGSLADLLGTSPEQAVSASTARAMAERAYRRARRLTADTQPVIGVACTAAIITDRERRGANRCWVAVRDHQRECVYGLELEKGRRDRLGEEAVVSRLVLRAIAEACDLLPAPLDLAASEQVLVEGLATRDPIADLLGGQAAFVLVQPDGQVVSDAPAPPAILSGSFNPLHAGHERLAQAAATALKLPVTFELPIVNPDKPALGYAEIERRLAQFRLRYSVALSRAPLFVDKAALYPGCVFVVGYDTAARLVEARYYGGEAQRDAALTAIRAAGCRFLVAGRARGAIFHTLADLQLPTGLSAMFQALPERAFRVDLSSSEIRAATRGVKSEE